MEDILFTDSNHQLKVAFQKRNKDELVLKDFDQVMLVTDETEGCLQKKSNQRKLSIPHSVSLIDIDGDCLSDLFLTVVDLQTGKTYFEIYLRREKTETSSYDSEEETAPEVPQNQTQT